MTGLVNTMVEDNAFTTLDPNAQLGVGFEQIPFEFKQINNFKPTRRGGLSKTFGFSLFKDVGTSTPIYGLYRFIKSDGTSLFIESRSGTVYKIVGGTETSIGMTVTAGAYLGFETAYDKMIVCDGVGAPQTYDGTTVANLTTGADATAATGFQQPVFHMNRLFSFSKTHDQSLLYYSNGGLIGSGYASNFINCNVNDGQKITSVSRLFIPGSFQPLLLVGKERSIGAIIGDGTATNPFTFIKVADDVGIPGFRQIVPCELDAAFLTNRGVSSYKTSLANNNIEYQLLSKNITNQFTGLNQTNLANAIGWLDWKNRRISYAVPSGTTAYPDKIWHYDLDLKGFYSQNGFDIASAFVDTDGTVYTGTSTGKIYKHDSTVNNYNGAAIPGVVQTPYLDFFEPHYYKRIVDGRMVVRGNGSYNLGVSCSLNNGTSTGSSHNIALGAGAYTWNGGTWNSGGTYLWGSSPLSRPKFYPGSIFENISFTINESGTNEPVDFLEMILEVEYLNLI